MFTVKIACKVSVIALAYLFLALLVVSCGGSDDPIAPYNPVTPTRESVDSPIQGVHQLWGFWNCYIPPTLDTIEFTPARMGMFHLNTRRFLEETACTNCLKLVSLDKDFVNMVITAKIQITHPFAGFDKYTGFDVRGVVISDGSLYFPLLDARVPYASSGDFTLLNPDGYTRLWNTTEFAPGSGPFPILEYSQGKFATPGSFTATVNPYIEFTQDPRSCFPAGASIQRDYKLTLKPGGAFFGYAIDASWEPPIVDPPIDINTDFPPSANAGEPYMLSMYMDEPLKNQVGDTAYLSIEMADRQAEFLPYAGYAECPDVWSGLKEPMVWGIGPGDPLWTLVFTGFDIVNDTDASPGEYPALIKVLDAMQDTYLGDINIRYALTTIKVKDYVVPDFSGLAVFTAPGPPGPGGEEGAANMFLLNLDTMVETQITNYVGMGAIFEEPRINAQGTRALLTFTPTPFNSHIEVYDIGGGSNSILPPDNTYYGHADFHPDGDHIVVASGTDYDNTTDLVTFNYDGSEWTKLATASGKITFPRWSPDGTRIAMIISETTPLYTSGLWIYDLGTQEFTMLVSGESYFACPSWNPAQPGGQDWIAYQSSKADPMGFWSDLFEINPDTLEDKLLYSTYMDERHPSYSPDGNYVMFATDGMMGSDLYIYAKAQNEAFQITYDDTYDDSPCWSWGW